MSVEDRAEIRRLHRAEGLPIKMIARTLGISRNTVRAALASEGPPHYVRKPAGSAVDAFEDAIRAQLKEVPTMPATVIAERVGWPGGMTVFNERVRELRPAYLAPDPAGRTTYDAGDIAQCDLWFPPVTVPVGYGQTRSPMQLPVLTMVLGYSRWLSAILLPSRRAEDLFAGWWQLIAALGAVPRTLVWDGEGAIGRWRSGRTELTGDCPRRARPFLLRLAEAHLHGARAAPAAFPALTTRCRSRPKIRFQLHAGLTGVACATRPVLRQVRQPAHNLKHRGDHHVCSSHRNPHRPRRAHHALHRDHPGPPKRRHHLLSRPHH